MPLPVLTIAQMRDWEKATWATGQTEGEVIRNVGEAVASMALRLSRAGELILILAGRGHNGDDARCARESLANRRVEALDVADPKVDLERLVMLLSLRPALIIDGLFGIGINRPLSSEWVRFIEKVNEAKGRVLAVDVPSGLAADTGQPQGAAVQASVTLTVGAPKVGLLQESAWTYVGRLEVTGDVGLIPCPCRGELQWTLAEDFAGFPPPRPVAAHKGTYGHLGILAGSVGYHGAAVLTARGAQRAQPGLVTLYTLEGVYVPIASQLQAVMVSPVREHLRVPDSWTGLLIGPGLAAQDIPGDLKEQVRQLWLESKLPMVVDASALDWLPPKTGTTPGLRVITPHPGEGARMLGTSAREIQANRFKAIRELSKTFGDAWVILKGHETLVGRSSGEIYVNSSGNPHLGQGGSGDVLAGYIAGLIAQPPLQSSPLEALRFAVWQHGAAADRLQAARPGWGVEELVEELGKDAEAFTIH